MDRKLLRSLITVILTCLSFASLVSSTANKKTGTCCSDGLGLNYTLPMFMECKEELHPNGSMVQKIPKLIPYSEKEAAACPRRKNKLGIKPGHRVCRFPDCDSNPCVNGWCEETMENYKCHCPAGYNGRSCDKQSSTSAPSTTADPEQPSTQQPSCQHPATSTTSSDSTTMSETMTTSTMGSETTSTAATDPTMSSTMSTDTTGSTTTQGASTMGSTTSDTTVTSGSTTTQEASTIGSTTTVTSASSADEESTTISTTDSTTSRSTTVSPTTQDTTTMSTTMKSTTSNPTTVGEPTVKIFVTDEGTDGKIFVADLQDQLSFTYIPSTVKPRFITYDSVDEKIYWTDEDDKRVYRADVDGGNRETVINDEEDRRGIAIAETSRTLYIANKGSKTITSMSMGEGSTIPGDETDFVSLDSEEPISLEVDEEQKYLYWTDTLGRIRRVSLDGNRVTTDLHIDSSLSKLYGLSIGPSSGGSVYLFFCDFGVERSFYYAEEDGFISTHELTNNGLTASGYDTAGIKLGDITYFKGVLYWAKADNPPSIAVMTDYQSASSRSYEIKQTSGIGKPYQLLITNVYP